MKLLRCKCCGMPIGRLGSLDFKSALEPKLKLTSIESVKEQLCHECFDKKGKA